MFSISRLGLCWMSILSVIKAEGDGAKGVVWASMVLSMMCPSSVKALVIFSWFYFLREKMG